MTDYKGLGFVTIMIILAVSALILRVALEGILKINITQNQTDAQARLKLVSVALENYAKDHLGNFPKDLSLLAQEDPPYMDKDYIARSPIKGYDYTCGRLDSSGYSCSARPVKCKLTGKMNYTVTTGGLLISEECI